MQRLVVALVTCCAVALSGCYVSTAPQTVLRGDAYHRTSLIRAPWRGQYLLYRIPDHTRDAIEEAGEPITSVHLQKGEYLGFNPHGPALAVAGGHEFPLEDGRYEWVMKADPRQLDPAKTTILTVVIVVGVVIVVVVVGAIIVSANAASALDHIQGF